MRLPAVLLIFTLIYSVASGQNTNLLEAYLGTTSHNCKGQNLEKLESLVSKLGAKDKKSDHQFLKSIFNTTHRQLLKEYKQYSDFGDIFETGKYDCLTATALYSIVLNRFGYEHAIIETNYHIFLLIESPEGKFLIESTDPLNGFEYQNEKIEARISRYKLDQEEAEKDKSIYSFGYKLFDEVTPQQLTGLLYYNQCVKAFNEQQWSEAAQLLRASKKYYNSPRTSEMENLLLNVIAGRELDKANTTKARGQQIAQHDQ